MDGADQFQQVGTLGIAFGHACVWSGTPESVVDLHPAGSIGAFFSIGYGVSNQTQVGIIRLISTERDHAALWRGTSSSFVDLHPPGGVSSNAYAVDGKLQGGSVAWTSGNPRAAIWQGTPESVVDLHPIGIGGSSEIRAMASGVQVGSILIAAGDFAAIWRGTAASFVNLSPPGQTYSKLFATTGTVHAGVMGQGGLSRAAVNFGTPSSWVGLHQFLPPQYGGTSAALAVWQEGPTVYVGGWAGNDAILWIGTHPCYVNCDQSSATPMLTANDFQCYLNRFASGDGYSNCDGSTGTPALTANDFQCFLNKFAGGCS